MKPALINISAMMFSLLLSETVSGSPSLDCFLQVHLSCRPKDAPLDSTCQDMYAQPKAIQCQSPPTELLLSFQGGPCSKSLDLANLDSNRNFRCLDFVGGPNDDKAYYIRVVPPRHAGNVYFEGNVTVGGVFAISDKTGGRLMEAVAVFVYQDSTRSQLVQLLLFESDCHGEGLSLGDDFGSVRVVEFTTDRQGTQSSRATAEYEIRIHNHHSTTSATIQDVHTVVDGQGHDLFAQELQGQEIAAGEELTIVQHLTVDLWKQLDQQQHVVGVMVGAMAGTNQCVASDEISISWDK